MAKKGYTPSVGVFAYIKRDLKFYPSGHLWIEYVKESTKGNVPGFELRLSYTDSEGELIFSSLGFDNYDPKYPKLKELRGYYATFATQVNREDFPTSLHDTQELEITKEACTPLIRAHEEAIDSLNQLRLTLVNTQESETVDQLLKERFRSFTNRFRKIR